MARQYATPTNYFLGIGGAGNTTTRSPSVSDDSSYASMDTRETSTSSVSRMKQAVASHWHKRNQRTSLYVAYNRKLPAYPGLFHSSADHPSAPKSKVYQDGKSMSSQETLVGKGASLMQKLAWKIERISDVGLDEAVKEGKEWQKIEA
jgi:hypothetical protein